jgi:hypothetical protein
MVARFKGAIMVPSAAARFLVVMGTVVAGLIGFAMIETWSSFTVRPNPRRSANMERSFEHWDWVRWSGSRSATSTL